MPEIYDFINSRDVRSYLREMNYQFTAPEAAFVVYWSKKPVKDKLRAWEEILHSMPDCALQGSESTGRPEFTSFHAFLREYMELLKRDIQNFSSGEGFLYSYKVFLNGRGGVEPGWCDEDEVFFSEYHLCIEHCKEHVCSDYINKIRVSKISIDCADGDPNKGNITFDRNMEMIFTDFCHENEYESDLAMAFENMCFSIPTPFKRGDILADYETNELPKDAEDIKGGLFVLSYVKTWNSKEMMSRGFHEYECPYAAGWDEFDRKVEKRLKKGDWSDMGAVGVCLRDNLGNFYYDSLILLLSTNLEYYRKPLKGLERQLQAYSCHEKGEIGGELLADSCFAIRIEEYSRNVWKGCKGYYSDEILKQIGLLPSEQDREKEEVYKGEGIF